MEFLHDGDCLRRVEFEVPSAEALNRRGEDFSALFFGDFQPFRVEDGKVIVNPGDEMHALATVPAMPSTLVAARHLFQLAAEGRVGSFPRPLFACGIGDRSKTRFSGVERNITVLNSIRSKRRLSILVRFIVEPGWRRSIAYDESLTRVSISDAKCS